MKSKIFVIAHRGYSSRSPENTLAAFRAAMAAKADMIELDIHLTRDGELVVTHDFELGRTCNGKGTLADFDSAQLRQLDAGSWFDPKFKTERLPLLSEVLALANNKIELNIELKEETIKDDASQQKMVEKCLELLDSHKAERNVLVSSFHWGVLEKLRAKNTTVRIGLLNHEPERGLRFEKATRIKAFSYHPNMAKLTAPMTSDIRGRGLKIFPYTANAEPEFAQLVKLGVHGIITNEVDLLQGFLAKN